MKELMAIVVGAVLFGTITIFAAIVSALPFILVAVVIKHLFF